jgi:hypothetical protein
MFTPTRFPAILVLGLGLGLFASAQPDTPTEETRPAMAAILKLAANLDRGDISLQARKIVAEHDGCEISSVFSMKRRGGVGIGSAIKAGHKDSIEHLVRNWSGAQPPTKEEVQTHRQDLLRVAQVLQAMAELAPYRMPQYPPNHQGKEKLVEEWRKVTGEFKASSRELRDAIQQSEPTEVRKAAVHLQRTCHSCHKLVDPEAWEGIRGGS